MSCRAMPDCPPVEPQARRKPWFRLGSGVGWWSGFLTGSANTAVAVFAVTCLGWMAMIMVLSTLPPG